MRSSAVSAREDLGVAARRGMAEQHRAQPGDVDRDRRRPSPERRRCGPRAAARLPIGRRAGRRPARSSTRDHRRPASVSRSPLPRRYRTGTSSAESRSSDSADIGPGQHVPADDDERRARRTHVFAARLREPAGCRGCRRERPATIGDWLIGRSIEALASSRRAAEPDPGDVVHERRRGADLTQPHVHLAAVVVRVHRHLQDGVTHRRHRRRAADLSFDQVDPCVRLWRRQGIRAQGGQLRRRVRWNARAHAMSSQGASKVGNGVSRGSPRHMRRNTCCTRCV